MEEFEGEIKKEENDEIRRKRVYISELIDFKTDYGREYKKLVSREEYYQYTEDCFYKSEEYYNLCREVTEKNSMYDTERLFFMIETIRALRKCLSKLNDEEILIIDLMFFSEKTEDEISKLLNVSQQSINKRKKIIFEKLRHELDDLIN